MRPIWILVISWFATSGFAADWKKAEPGWRYEFPRDHHAHNEFKTEWWYFTGNLFDTEGHRFGYELTFFRQGIRPPAERDPNSSRFIVDDLKFAHFALTDVKKGQFRFEQKTSRGSFDEAGFDDGERLAWINNWSLTATSGGGFDLTAKNANADLHLHLRAIKGPVIHGENGVSVKASTNGHASHYYSVPRLETTGEITLDGKIHSIRGETWFDHEWATGQLAEGQAGWDWICVQWDDGTELMLYRMRLQNGESDPSSSGTLIEHDRTPSFLRSTDFEMKPIAFWKSKANGATYPIGWKVTIPGKEIEFVVRATVEDQELVIDPITYWEGAIDASGTRNGKPIKGYGYLELTGYAGRMGEAEGLKR